MMSTHQTDSIYQNEDEIQGKKNLPSDYMDVDRMWILAHAKQGLCL